MAYAYGINRNDFQSRENQLRMIPYGHQNIDNSDIEAVAKAMRGEFLSTGPLVEEFEHNLEAFTGAPTTVVSSGTAALHCAYKAINIQQGDEVITPPLTFVATQATAIQLGAKIIFADVQSDTGNIDPSLVESLITKKTKAVVAVDYAGHPAELDELKAITEKHGIYLIEDAAHSLGSTYKDRLVGSIADITTFSFFPTKNITTGEGGAVSTSDPELLKRAKLFARQGLVRDKSQFKLNETGPWHQEVHEFGLNYRLPDILCALGINQLRKLNDFKNQRARIWDYYSETLLASKFIKTPIKRNYVNPTWHLYPIRVPSDIRENIVLKLRELGIGVQINYIPAFWHPVFNTSNMEDANCPIAEDFYKCEISLPIYTDLTNSNQEFIVSSLLKILYA